VTLTVQNNTEVELGDVADTYAADQARDAAVSLRQVEARQQAPDHPILYNVPETDYLKFYIFQVV
jgi:23S rRNA G2069 N7-methylase RlmK/C1962 C5-methylase RlmI